MVDLKAEDAARKLGKQVEYFPGDKVFLVEPSGVRKFGVFAVKEDPVDGGTQRVGISNGSSVSSRGIAQWVLADDSNLFSDELFAWLHFKNSAENERLVANKLHQQREERAERAIARIKREDENG